MTGQSGEFIARPIGFTPKQQATMLATLGFDSLEDLIDHAVPQGVRSPAALNLPPAASEAYVLAELRGPASCNDPAEAMIELSYHGTITLGVIRRRVVESPACYTPYTPYQPEISQGRLKVLLNFQTMVADLSGLTTSNSSLLHEGTAVAEAMTAMRRASKVTTERIVVETEVLPQSLAVLQIRCRAIGVEVLVADLTRSLPEEEFFGVVVQYPEAPVSSPTTGPLWQQHTSGERW